MARNKARPGRTVTVFFIGLAVAYGLVALIGTWKPALGLDLEGGTQIVLTAKGNVSKDNLNEAADIIDSRVNGSGVSEATVTTQGGNQIVVQVPGATQDNLVQTVDTSGAAAVPPGRAGAAEHHHDAAAVVGSSTSPGAGVTKPATAEGLVQPRALGQEPPAGAPRQGQGREGRDAAKAKATSSPSSEPQLEPVDGTGQRWQRARPRPAR